MGMSIKAAGQGGGRRRRRGGAKAPMSEINVTPFVDVMLVLLIIFMVAAPMMTAGVPVDLPEAKGKALQSNSEPVTVTVAASGDVYIGETKMALDELTEKLKAIAKNGVDEQIIVRGDKGINYGTVLQVFSKISAGGFRKVSLLTVGSE